MAKPDDPDDFEVSVSFSEDDADLTPPPMGVRGSALPARPFPPAHGPDSQTSDVDATGKFVRPERIAPGSWAAESTRPVPVPGGVLEKSERARRRPPAPTHIIQL